MAITHVATVATSLPLHGGTSAAMDTTGADLLVLSVSWWGGSGDPAISDSKGNTWTPLTNSFSGSSKARLWYAQNAIVGTSHTFSATGTNLSPAIIVHAFAGADLTAPLDSDTATANSGSVTSITTTAATPSVNGALVVSGWCAGNVSSIAVDSGLTQTTLTFVPGVTMAGATGYLVQGTAASIQPTWTWTTGSSAGYTRAFFKAAAAALTGTARLTQLVAETLILPASTARLTQMVAETLSNVAAPTAAERVDTFLWLPV